MIKSIYKPRKETESKEMTALQCKAGQMGTSGKEQYGKSQSWQDKALDANLMLGNENATKRHDLLMGKGKGLNRTSWASWDNVWEDLHDCYKVKRIQSFIGDLDIIKKDLNFLLNLNNAAQF